MFQDDEISSRLLGWEDVKASAMTAEVRSYPSSASVSKIAQTIKMTPYAGISARRIPGASTAGYR